MERNEFKEDIIKGERMKFQKNLQEFFWNPLQFFTVKLKSHDDAQK